MIHLPHLISYRIFYRLCWGSTWKCARQHDSYFAPWRLFFSPYPLFTPFQSHSQLSFWYSWREVDWFIVQLIYDGQWMGKRESSLWMSEKQNDLGINRWVAYLFVEKGSIRRAAALKWQKFASSLIKLTRASWRNVRMCTDALCVCIDCH